MKPIRHAKASLKKTKVIATYGPACANQKDIQHLIASGVDVIRINSSHLKEASEVAPIVNLIRKAAKKAKSHVGIMLDLQGPKIRLGDFKEKQIVLKEGNPYSLNTETILGDQKACHISYAKLPQELKPGEIIYIDDGKVQLQVKRCDVNTVQCKTLRGGKLSSRKGLNLPHSNLSVSAMTKKDFMFADAAIDSGCDYVAISFVSCKKDLLLLREYLDTHDGKELHIIAKIERQQALDNIDDIIDHSQAIMVARGDLGVEIGVENVPKAQKMIIQKTNYKIKPVIVATQMLESMIYQETATRAEASDVANAIYDQCDAVMLSGETAVGISPVSAVETMVNICQATDAHMLERKEDTDIFQKRVFYQADTPTIMCKAGERIVEETKSDFILSFTSTGNTPRINAKLYPPVPIISPTDDISICQRMCLYRSVIPLLIGKKFKDIHRWRDMISVTVEQAKAESLLFKGDKLVVLAGIPIGLSGGLNSIRLINVK